MTSGSIRDVFASLDDADRQLVRLVCTGLTDEEIGSRLRQPERVISERLGGILSRIGAASRTQLVISVVCHGL